VRDPWLLLRRRHDHHPRGQLSGTVGGNDYTCGSPFERWHRDAKIFTIFEGTSEIQRMLIGRAVTGLDVR
jgi:alkylation response protein AidB-like acyl-CoA dehydrogenase